MEDAWFLVGSEDLETEWLRARLDRHPEMAWPCAFDFALDWPAAKRGAWPDLIEYWGALAESREARRSRIVIRGDLDFPDLVRSLLAQLAARARKPVFGVAVHGHLERVLRLWPDARFVRATRPTTAAASGASGPWAAFGDWVFEHEWRRLCARVPAQRRIEASGEALARDPERELARLCAALGVAYAPEMAERSGSETSAAPPPRRARPSRGTLGSRFPRLARV
jgi:hypothetical protein